MAYSLTPTTIRAASTYQFTSQRSGLTYGFRKDGAVWNILGATVSAIFTGPDGTVLTRAATIDSAANGVASYTCLTTDFPVSMVGVWSIVWRVVQGSIDITSEIPHYFTVGV